MKTRSLRVFAAVARTGSFLAVSCSHRHGVFRHINGGRL